MGVNHCPSVAATLIEIARRRQRPGSGSRQTRPARVRLGMNFKKLISVPFVIAGGQATRMYMPERSTLVWDLLIHSDDLKVAGRDLEQSGATTFAPLTIPGFTCQLPDGTPLDVLASNEPWITLALESPARDLDGQPVVRLPWLILMKLKSGRVQDLADISRMLAWAEDSTVEETRSAVKEFLPEAADDVQSLLELGRLERGNAA